MITKQQKSLGKFLGFFFFFQLQKPSITTVLVQESELQHTVHPIPLSSSCLSTHTSAKEARFLTNFRALSSVLNTPSHLVSPSGDALITTYILTFMLIPFICPLPWEYTVSLSILFPYNGISLLLIGYGIFRIYGFRFGIIYLIIHSIEIPDTPIPSDHTDVVGVILWLFWIMQKLCVLHSQPIL